MLIVQFMASEKWGGAEKVFVDISNSLAEKHHLVAILLRSTQYSARFSGKVEIIELQSHPTRHNPFLLYELYTVLRRLRPDIVHTHADKASELVKKVSLLLRLNHLATKHNARKGRVFNHLPWVTVVSEESKHSVRSRRESHIRVINNGITPVSLSFAENKVAITRSAFSLATIGRLDKIKGFDRLIEQVSRLTFPFHLYIVGEGDERERLQQCIDLYRLQEKVTLMGFCDNIAEIMHHVDAVVISSHSEGFPQVMVESLFYANVLIATPVGGVVEILPSQFLAEQSEIAARITTVAENYPYYCELFATLKNQKSSEFLLSKIVGKYENIYIEILRRSY